MTPLLIFRLMQVHGHFWNQSKNQRLQIIMTTSNFLWVS